MGGRTDRSKGGEWVRLRRAWLDGLKCVFNHGKTLARAPEESFLVEVTSY
jgi:hypothetical protein